jgi:hypothetical protein
MPTNGAKAELHSLPNILNTGVVKLFFLQKNQSK